MFIKKVYSRLLLGKLVQNQGEMGDVFQKSSFLFVGDLK